MASLQAPDRGEKPIPKLLNPNAEPFHLPVPATQYCLLVPHQIYGGQTGRPEITESSPQEMVPRHEEGFPSVWGLFPHHPYAQYTPAAYDPCSFGFRTLTLRLQPQTQPADIPISTCQLGNEQSVEAIRISNGGEEEKMGEIGRKIMAFRTRCCQQKLSSRRARKRVRLEWKLRAENRNLHQNNSDDHFVIPFPTTMEEAESSATTTVMLKNIPNQYLLKDLLSILDRHCSELNGIAESASIRSEYDFLYLPMDYKKYAFERRLTNLGYAFVNFTTTRAAFLFYQQFNGHRWDRKTCEVTCAELQGKEELKKRFQYKIFRCVCPKFRPVEFAPARDGFNGGIRGIPVGIFKKGLPEKSIQC